MFVAVDKDGDEYIYSSRPSRRSIVWVHAVGGSCVIVPKGTIERLLNYPLTWDDDCQEIVEYKDKDLKEDKMIKQNIKMRVTPEQSKKVQEICFENGVYWNLLPKKWDIGRTTSKFLYIEDVITHSFSESLYSDDVLKEENDFFNEQELEEVDADLFIKTNGSCEDESTLNDDDIARILKASEDQPIEYLIQKIVNLHDQLNKYRKNIQNQKEELTRLLNQKKQLNNRLDIYALCNDNQKIKITNLLAQKEELQSQLNMANKTVGMSIDTDIKLIRLLEEKDEIIKYLENKLVKKINEAYEKKVMSFEELYIKQADEYYKKVEDKVMGFVIKDLESKLYN